MKGERAEELDLETFVADVERLGGRDGLDAGGRPDRGSVAGGMAAECTGRLSPTDGSDAPPISRAEGDAAHRLGGTRAELWEGERETPDEPRSIYIMRLRVRPSE